MTNCLDLELALDRFEEPERRIPKVEFAADIEAAAEKAAKEAAAAPSIGEQALK